MVHKKLTACQTRVLKHLKGDSQTWLKLSKKAKEEYLSDVKLMKKIKGN
jgi:hypothetical protein